MTAAKVIAEAERRFGRIPELGERHTLCAWVREVEGDGVPAPFIDMSKYGELLTMLPDKIVSNLEKARMERVGVGPMLRAGLGYEELLYSIIVDGTAIASSSAEARLVPATMIPAGYLQPGGVPGRTLHWKLRGRETTLTTAGTLTFRLRDGTTDALTTTLAASGALTMDVTGGTNNMWFTEGMIVVRAVGTSGSVFVIGDATVADQALTLANQRAQYMGSAGSSAPAAVTLDLTVNRYWNWTAQWSLATAYSIQAHTYILESLN